jgi:hypothetical protein
MHSLTNQDFEYLRKLDGLFTSDSETVKDLIDQAITVQGILDPNMNSAYTMGPFQKLINTMLEMSATINRLNTEVSELRNIQTSKTPPGYWPHNGITWPSTSTSPYPWSGISTSPDPWSGTSTSPDPWSGTSLGLDYPTNTFINNGVNLVELHNTNLSVNANKLANQIRRDIGQLGDNSSDTVAIATK